MASAPSNEGSGEVYNIPFIYPLRYYIKRLYFFQGGRWFWAALVRGFARGCSSAVMKYSINWVLEVIIANK